MSRKIIAIDGASRRSGKPDCTAAGGIFICDTEDPNNYCCTDAIHEYSNHAVVSTSQRGELLGLILGLSKAIQLLKGSTQTVYIITDSEYMFNAVTKEWYKSWPHKGWLTSMGELVKNIDLWRSAAALLDECESIAGKEIVFYHIKGHVIPFGKVMGTKLIQQDATGATLFHTALGKLILEWDIRMESVSYGMELFKRNNGFYPPEDIFQKMVACNIVVDFVATSHVEYKDKTRLGSAE